MKSNCVFPVNSWDTCVGADKDVWKEEGLSGPNSAGTVGCLMSWMGEVCELVCLTALSKWASCFQAERQQSSYTNDEFRALV